MTPDSELTKVWGTLKLYPEWLRPGWSNNFQSSLPSGLRAMSLAPPEQGNPCLGTVESIPWREGEG